MHATQRMISPQATERVTPRTARHSLRWIGRALVAASVCGLVLLSGFGLLAVADYNGAANKIPDPRARAQWTLVRGDHLHFAFHIMAGRVLDLCPCTHRAAAGQYYRARFHALTPLQKAIVDATRPATVPQWLIYVFGPAVVGLDWLGDGLAWLGGQWAHRS